MDWQAQKLNKNHLQQFKGIRAFSKPWQIVFQNDSHAQGSIDRILIENAIRICEETHQYLYRDYSDTSVAALQSDTKPIVSLAKNITTDLNDEELTIEEISTFTQSLGNEFDWTIDHIILGGTEEALIQRGTAWCMDVARVGCILLQAIGIATRNLRVAPSFNALWPGIQLQII